MEGLSKIQREAMKILLESFNGLRYDEWCNKVEQKNNDFMITKIKKETKKLIKKDWRVQVIEEGKDPLYCHLELLM